MGQDHKIDIVSFFPFCWRRQVAVTRLLGRRLRVKGHRSTQPAKFSLR